MRYQSGSVLQTLVLSMLQDEASTLKRQDVASTLSVAFNLLNPQNLLNLHSCSFVIFYLCSFVGD